MVRSSSAAAYQQLSASGKRQYNTMLILKTLKRNRCGLTRREIEDKTGLRINQVTGRVRELLDQKRLVEESERICRITGNMVGVVQLRD